MQNRFLILHTNDFKYSKSIRKIVPFHNFILKKIDINNFELIELNISKNELVKLIYRISLKKNINIINICSGKGIRLKNLIKKICKDEDIKPNIIYVKNKISKYESNAFYGDSKKLRKFLK